MKATTLAKLERHIRKQFVLLFPPRFVISQYSKKRQDFLKRFEEDIPKIVYSPPEKFSTTLWDIKFNSQIMNAAGMFKNGECYQTVAMQGAGAYKGGSTTWNRRVGNSWKDKKGREILQPFVPLPRSKAALNFLGLPNDGDEINSSRVSKLERINNCPVGWSISTSPDIKGEEKLEKLVSGMRLYDKAGVDWIEVNGKCPNTNHDDEYDNLEIMLPYISDNFLRQRQRNIPVVVKLSADTELKEIPYLMDLLFDLRFDGVNFGNTSINYQKHRPKIHPKERALYDFFTQNIGGALSGKLIEEDNFNLCKAAATYKKKRGTVQEFHIIRTGGIIGTWKDIQESKQAGISLNQFFTGYWESFAKHGHNVYKNLLEHQSKHF